MSAAKALLLSNKSKHRDINIFFISKSKKSDFVLLNQSNNDFFVLIFTNLINSLTLL